MKHKKNKEKTRASSGRHLRECGYTRQFSSLEPDTQRFYFLSAYWNPFLPMVDLSFAADQLINALGKWKTTEHNAPEYLLKDK